MNKVLIYSLLIVFLGACGQEQSSEASSAAPATESKSKSSKSKSKREPKWEVAVDGMPELSGRIITAIGSIKGGNFALGRRGFTSSISLTEKGEISFMTMSFKDLNTRCLNYGDVVANINGTRVELTGEVRCSPIEGDDTEQRRAQVNAWFETKK
jgi:hypothetical protein